MRVLFFGGALQRNRTIAYPAILDIKDILDIIEIFYIGIGHEGFRAGILRNAIGFCDVARVMNWSVFES